MYIQSFERITVKILHCDKNGIAIDKYKCKLSGKTVK